jgi:hypothetical protein
MKFIQFLISDQISPTILYLIIVFANIDYVGVLDYSIKAIIGSAVWFGFRALGDFTSQKIKRNFNHKKEKQA